jgi:hypothetical protein
MVLLDGPHQHLIVSGRIACRWVTCRGKRGAGSHDNQNQHGGQATNLNGIHIELHGAAAKAAQKNRTHVSSLQVDKKQRKREGRVDDESCEKPRRAGVLEQGVDQVSHARGT